MDFDDIVVKESPGLCRCCLSEGCYKDLSTEYSWMNETEIYADMLLECFDISISQHMEGPNGLNRLICEVCITRLRDACNFKKQVVDSEKKFVDMVGRGEFRPKVVIYQQDMKPENLEGVDDNAVDFLDDDVLYYEADDDKMKPDEPQTSSTSISLPKKAKRGRPRKNPDVKIEKKAKLKAKEVKARTSKSVNRDYDAEANDAYSTGRRRKNLEILFNSTTVMPFKWRGRYHCFFCAKSSCTYQDFKKHTKSHGSCSIGDYALKAVTGKHIEIKVDVSEIICEICFEPFQTLNEVIDHLIGKHSMQYDKTVDTPYKEYRLCDLKCTHCEKQFAYFIKLVIHINKVHPHSTYICDGCGIVYTKKRYLLKHIRQHHNANEIQEHKSRCHYECHMCALAFKNSELLQRHVSEHGLNQGSMCNLSSLTNDLKCENNISKSNVDLCKSDADKFIVLKQNVQHIRNNIQCVLNMSTALPFKFFSKFSCFYCGRKYTEFDELREHTVSEHSVCDPKAKYMKKFPGDRVKVKVEISRLNCKVCDLAFEDINILIDHLVLEHNALYNKSITCFEPFRITKDNIPCPICSEVFRYFLTLLRHLNSEHSNNKIICDFCGRSFNRVSNLQMHIKYSHSKTSECEICGVKYKNEGCLLRHKAKCHDIRNFKCPKCPERFESNYQKAKHMIKVHQIGHKCTFCEKMFTRNSFMKDHIRRMHYKEKNVPCSVCNERFFDNYTLRLHMVKHDGERKFSCSICNKAFLRRSNLNSHMDMHKKYGHLNI